MNACFKLFVVARIFKGNGGLFAMGLDGPVKVFRINLIMGGLCHHLQSIIFEDGGIFFLNFFSVNDRGNDVLVIFGFKCRGDCDGVVVMYPVVRVNFGCVKGTA